MKKLSAILSLLLALALLAGCAGTPVVYYTECTCPVGSHTQTPAPTNPAPTNPPAEGALKTGLAIIATASGSADAGEKNGEAKFDVDVAAVLVDENGVIVDCVIDSLGTSVAFDTTGAIVTDLGAQVLTKTELGYDYNMKNYGSAYEWFEQAQALADYAVGKTAQQLRSGAITEAGTAKDADLATVASIYLGGYVAAIEKAVANAQHLGAQAGDELRLASVSSLGKSAAATAEAAGTAQLDMDVTALTLSDGVITSCVIDSLQAKVSFDASGAITGGNGAFQTKVELGDGYNMKLYGNASFEWYEQAASLAAYVTGKTPAEVAGIAVTEGTVPTDADLAASVTIAIGGYQALIAKAAG